MLDPQMMILEFYELFGEVSFKNKKINVDFYKQGILSRMYVNKSDEIRMLQDSDIYKNFRKYFVKIFNEKKQRAEKILINCLKPIFQQFRINIPVENMARTSFDLTSFTPDIKELIKVQPAYKKYEDFR